LTFYRKYYDIGELLFIDDSNIMTSFAKRVTQFLNALNLGSTITNNKLNAKFHLFYQFFGQSIFNSAWKLLYGISNACVVHDFKASTLALVFWRQDHLEIFGMSANSGTDKVWSPKMTEKLENMVKGSREMLIAAKYVKFSHRENSKQQMEVQALGEFLISEDLENFQNADSQEVAVEGMVYETLDFEGEY